MALSVNNIYEFCLKLIRKNQSSGLASTEFTTHWNDAQATYQDDLLGRFQARSNGKTGINTGLLENETILTKLSPFTKKATLVIAAGSSNKPTGFIYRLAIRIGGEMVEKINHNQIYAVNKSVIDPANVSDEKYYFVEYESRFEFLPSSVTSAVLDYICAPTDVVWAYTLDGSGRQVYTSVGSVQPQWDDNSNREITKRMLTNLGVSFKDNDFQNFGKSVQLTGE